MPSEPENPVPERPINWESFYRDYRKPGYVTGYEIQTQLGSGAFGIVFKATKESIGKPYAIKFLKVDDVEVRQAVVRELDAVRYFAQVDHPNLVSIEDLGEVDGIPYIVMAFAGDDTLRKRMDSGELDRESALHVFDQVCRGVQALHEHSLVHFDIKPANVYLKGDIARIGDYGLSKLVTDSRNSLSMGRGTPYYMAPELLRRKGDARSDIYALGVLLYELLCGEPPFTGDSEWEVLRKHEEQEPTFPAGLGETERAVILRAMEKEPDARFESVADMIAAMHGESVSATPRAKGPFRQDEPRTAAADSTPRPFRDRPRTRMPSRRSAAGLLGFVGCGGFLMLFLMTAFWSLRSERSIAMSGMTTPDTPAIETYAFESVSSPGIPSEKKLLRLTELLSPRLHARTLAVVKQIPSGYPDDNLFATYFARHAGPLLHVLIRELDDIGTVEAMTWSSLLQEKSRKLGR